LPAVEVPRVLVLDHAGLHGGAVVQAPREDLARRGIFSYDLPG
jgi:hypothetical protein